MMESTGATTTSPAERSPPRATFILRLWREQLDEARAEWRGTVEHVQSGERRAVRDPDGAAEVVAAWLRAAEQFDLSEEM
jgi:hypothetical protein